MSDLLGVKISELPEITDLEGTHTIGTDKNTKSGKVSLGFIKDAANYANAQGDYAKEVGDAVAGNVGSTDYPEFSASGIYAIGDVVRYKGRLYRFTAPHQSGAWNGADVILTSVNSEVKTAISEFDSTLKTQSQSIVSYKETINAQVEGQNQEIDAFKEAVTDQVNNYAPIVINGDVTNAPDEEDLTSENGLLKFKNRSSLDGIGYVILRKNIPLADQINLPNTIYEIRYDFDLGGSTLNIESGCILDFRGGSLNNGTLVGANTRVSANIYHIFKNITIDGTWLVETSYPQWFGADSTGLVECSNAIYEAIKFGGTCFIPNGVYDVNNLTIWERKVVRGEGRGTILNVHNSIDIASTNGLELRNMVIRGVGDVERETLINVVNCFHAIIENVEIYDEGGKVTNGICCDSTIKSYYHNFYRCRISGFPVGVRLTHNANACTIQDCEFYVCGIGVIIDSCNGTRILNNTFQTYKTNAIRLEYNNYGSQTRGNIIIGNYFESDYFDPNHTPTAKGDIDFTNNPVCSGNTIIGNNVTYNTNVKPILNNPGGNFIIYPTNATRSFATLQLEGGLTKLQVAPYGTPDAAYPGEIYAGAIGVFETPDGIPEFKVCVRDSNGQYYWQKFVPFKKDGSQIDITVPLTTTSITQYYGGSIKLGYEAGLSDRNITFDSGRKRLKYGYSNKWHYIQTNDSYAKGNEPTSPLVGDMIFDLTSRVPKWWSDFGWVNAMGLIAAKASGSTSERPTNCSVGHCFFDTNLGKPIWAKQVTENSVTWCDANGTIV